MMSPDKNYPVLRRIQIANADVNNVDEASSTVSYIGQETHDGIWFIQKVDTSSGTAVTYASRKNNDSTTSYSTAWTNRASLTYGTLNQAFS